MRKNIRKVLDAFVAGQPAIGDSKRTCHTDGVTLYSYAMPIARRIDATTYVVVGDDSTMAGYPRQDGRGLFAGVPAERRRNYPGLSCTTRGQLRAVLFGLELAWDPSATVGLDGEVLNYGHGAYRKTGFVVHRGPLPECAHADCATHPKLAADCARSSGLARRGDKPSTMGVR